MRVLTGKLKGRKLLTPKDVRPVSERVRKSCFDILSQEVEGKKILDLFAGSGSLGIEALSRGAKDCVFIDSSFSVLKVLKRNIASLGIESETRVYLRDAFKAINFFSARNFSFDIVFLDPPYYRQLLTKTLQQLSEYDIVGPSGYLVAFCYQKDLFVKKSGVFRLKINKKYGQTLLLIYAKD